jgi:hypothetical protein
LHPPFLAYGFSDDFATTKPLELLEPQFHSSFKGFQKLFFIPAALVVQFGIKIINIIERTKCHRHLPFAICHLSFVICHLSFVICHLSFGICHLSFVIWHLSFVICHLPLGI